MQINSCFKFAALASVIVTMCTFAVSNTQAQSPSGPPPIPTFDAVTVTNMLSNIDVDQNRAIFEVGYILPQGSSECPIAQGYALIGQAISQAPRGSRRWFILYSIKALAAFHCEGLPLSDGFSSYNTIADSSPLAASSGAVSDLRQSIIVFVSSVPTVLSQMHLQNDPRTIALLHKFWLVYTTLPLSDDIRVEPVWCNAFAAINSDNEFLPDIKRTLSMINLPCTFGIAQTEAVVLHNAGSALAIPTLKSAEHLADDDVQKTRWYYTTLADWLAQSGDVRSASQAAALRVRLTGHGYGELASDQFSSNDQAGLAGTLRQLKQPGADQGELNNAATALAALYLSDPQKYAGAATLAIAILEPYLSSSTVRDPEQDLQARLTLGNLYMASGKFALARQILAAAKPDTNESIPGHYNLHLSFLLMERVQQLLTSIPQDGSGAQ